MNMKVFVGLIFLLLLKNQTRASEQEAKNQTVIPFDVQRNHLEGSWITYSRELGKVIIEISRNEETGSMWEVKSPAENKDFLDMKLTHDEKDMFKVRMSHDTAEEKDYPSFFPFAHNDSNIRLANSTIINTLEVRLEILSNENTLIWSQVEGGSYHYSLVWSRKSPVELPLRPHNDFENAATSFLGHATQGIIPPALLNIIKSYGFHPDPLTRKLQGFWQTKPIKSGIDSNSSIEEPSFQYEIQGSELHMQNRNGSVGIEYLAPVQMPSLGRDVSFVYTGILRRNQRGSFDGYSVTTDRAHFLSDFTFDNAQNNASGKRMSAYMFKCVLDSNHIYGTMRPIETGVWFFPGYQSFYVVQYGDYYLIGNRFISMKNKNGRKVLEVKEASGGRVEPDTVLELYGMQVCDFCGHKSTKRCGACKTAKYCSLKCQKADWKYHKKFCTGRFEHKHTSSNK